MNTVFEILPSDYEPELCMLFCEVSNEGFSFCIKDDSRNSFLGLGMYHFDTSKPFEGFPIALQVLFHQVGALSKKFKQVRIAYSIPQSVLIPFSMYKNENCNTVMKLMFGDMDDNETILTDEIPLQKMYNCYRVSEATIDTIRNQFPDALITHQYSQFLKTPLDENDKLSVIFYSKKVVIHLIKNKKHHLVNSYSFQTPEDVSYILLNICNQLDLGAIQLAVSGLVEENSALYKELYKYFDHIELSDFREGTGYSDEIKAFPSHYFRYIFDMASCE